MSARFAQILMLLMAITSVACSGNLQDTIKDTLPHNEAEYKSSRSLPPLEIPPDLRASTIQDQLVVPGELGLGTATYSEYQDSTSGNSSQVSTVLPELTDVRVEGLDEKRWLVIRAKPAEVWPRVRSFWLSQGLLIKLEDPSIGIMETDWAENRADIPEGFIRGFLEKISSKLYSAATRDKFRVRLERGAEPDTTELYLSHRGAEEVAKGEDFVWQPRPANPELEAEMLNRLVLHFGLSQEKADRLLADSTPRADRAHLSRDGQGGAALTLDEAFSRAWRRTGLALDRVGFTVEDRDRSRGLYYVRYVDPLKDAEIEGKGFFSKLVFWGDDESKSELAQTAYLISLRETDEKTSVVVLNTEGERDFSPTADRILSLLQEQLK